MPSRPRVEELDSSMVWSMSTERHSLWMVLPVSTEVLFPQLLASLSTMVSTSVSMILSVHDNSSVQSALSHFFSEPVVPVDALEGSFLVSFILGWGVTIGADLASYHLDTIW